MKIGLFGGTFDPIHTAHIELANIVLEEFSLDKIIFIPSGKSYFKNNVTNKWARYEMVKLAIASFPKFDISDIETKRFGNSYACNTVKTLKKIYPENTFFWIMGSDSFLELPTWKNYNYLLKNLNFIVYMRPGDSLVNLEITSKKYKDEFHTSISLIENAKYYISSSEIREHIHDKDFSFKTLPQGVENYIKKNNIY